MSHDGPGVEFLLMIYVIFNKSVIHRVSSQGHKLVSRVQLFAFEGLWSVFSMVVLQEHLIAHRGHLCILDI